MDFTKSESLEIAYSRAKQIAAIDPTAPTGVIVGETPFKHELTPFELAQRLANQIVFQIEGQRDMDSFKKKMGDGKDDSTPGQ
ncbi:hypothetical protein [Schleiferilactobacillus perolens]|jgi:hypothetical protein|uniref:hypothetical protein n=1 Tax=Schleiferilactobacillus perolens TaxID=100468 RepID=UPI00235363B9|nr:hypothetical protein [Schleiferilactobacillus perolens]MCI2170718.1 hypothetical protein [Schleiferilactobacillus perolens]